jgi:hypothetical protein
MTALYSLCAYCTAFKLASLQVQPYQSQTNERITAANAANQEAQNATAHYQYQYTVCIVTAGFYIRLTETVLLMYTAVLRLVVVTAGKGSHPWQHVNAKVLNSYCCRSIPLCV